MADLAMEEVSSTRTRESFRPAYFNAWAHGAVAPVECRNTTDTPPNFPPSDLDAASYTSGEGDVARRDVFLPNLFASTMLREYACHGASKKLGPAGERVQEAKPFPLALAASSEGSNLTTANPPVPWPPAVDDRSSSPNEQVDIESQSSDFEDAVDMVFEKLRRKKQAMAAKHDANKATLLGELQQALGARNATEEELRTAQVKHKDLEVAAEKQRTEFAEFKSKATRLKTFVDGLGKDIDVLRRDRVTLQQKVVQLSAQAEEQHAKRDALLIDVSNMNSELVKVDRATRCKLVESTTLAIRLQHEVHEKTQLLTQERSLREGILGRLESLHEAAAVATDEIKSSNIGIRDKLCEIHAAVEARENEPGTSAVLESIATGVRGLDLKHVTAVQDVNTIKTMLETLSQSFESISTTPVAESDQEASIKSYLEGMLNSIKADLSRQEELAGQHATDQNIVLGLKQELAESRSIVSCRMADLKILQASESGLKDKIAELQAAAEAFTAQTLDESQLEELKIAVKEKSTLLESAQISLDSKATEASKLSDQNTNLLVETEALKKRLDDMEVAKTQEREDLRGEMTTRATEYVRAERAKDDNEIKRCATERERLSQQVKDLDARLASVLEELRQKQDDLEQLQQLRDSTDEVTKALQAAQTDLSKTASRNKEMEEELHALKLQFSAQEEECSKVSENNRTLAEQVKCVQVASGEAEGLKQQLAAMEQRTSQRLTIMELDIGKARKQNDALQLRLEESEQELAREGTSQESFAADVQRRWTEEDLKHTREIASANKRVTEEEARGAEILADNERLKAKLATVRRSHEPVPRGRTPEHAPMSCGPTPGGLAPMVEEFSPLTLHGGHGASQSGAVSESDDAQLSRDQEEEESAPSFARFHASRTPLADSKLTSYPRSSAYNSMGEAEDLGGHSAFSQPAARESHPWEVATNSNCSKKIIRSNSEVSRERETSSQHLQRGGPASRFRTPEPRFQASQEAAIQSSSPAFVANAATPRLRNYQALQSMDKQGSSMGSVNKKADAAPKRKASSQLVSGYEHDRKKRNDRAFNSQPSAGTRRLASSQMPCLKTTRQTRGGKKISKNDVMTARFARELDD